MIRTQNRLGALRFGLVAAVGVGVAVTVAFVPCLQAQEEPKDPGLHFGFELIAGAISGPPGAFDAHVTLTVEARDPPYRIKGWSFSVTAEAGSIESISLEELSIETQVFEAGTLVESPSLKVLDAAFKTANQAMHPVDGRKGVVSAVGLSFSHAVYLEPGATHRIARIRVVPDGDPMLPVTLQLEDGFQGPGQPVRNAVVDLGTTAYPALENLTVVPSDDLFGWRLPGDANEDARLDISDVVWLLGHLFLGEHPTLPCEGGTSAAPGNGAFSLVNANGDDNLDIGDVVYVLFYLFNVGTPPVLGQECTRILGCTSECAQ